MTTLLLVAVGALGWMLLEQDRSLERERVRERLARTSSDLRFAVEDRLREMAGVLATLPPRVPAGGVHDLGLAYEARHPGTTFVVADAEGIGASPAGALRYVPAAYVMSRPRDPWSEADRLEFADADTGAALRALAALEARNEPWIQAGTIARKARIARRAGQEREAMALYESLAQRDRSYVESVPAPWLAHYARATMLDAAGDPTGARREATRLDAALERGGWAVARATYAFYRAAADRWLEKSVALGEAVHPVSEALLRELRPGSAPAFGSGDSAINVHPALGVFAVSQGAPTSRRLALLSREGLVSGPVADTSDAAEAEGIAWKLTDSRGTELVGRSAGEGDGTMITPLPVGATGLLLHVWATPALRPLPADQRRRALLLAGLLLALAVIATGAYFTARALAREAETARLKADFLAAVSHELRTPLTSIRQLSELLAAGRVDEPERAARYFELLHREASRLHVMVEDLLDFGRMEAGRTVYREERIDVTRLVAETVEQFRAERPDTAGRVDCACEPSLEAILDRESLTRSIWNLLDNAARYAGEDAAIHVRAAREGENVAVRVRDEGVGIGREEAGRIFERFVRGDAAETARARGTGLGLSIVRTMLEAQGASIELEDTPGGGATFVVRLKAAGME